MPKKEPDGVRFMMHSLEGLSLGTLILLGLHVLTRILGGFDETFTARKDIIGISLWVGANLLILLGLVVGLMLKGMPW